MFCGESVGLLLLEQSVRCVWWLSKNGKDMGILLFVFLENRIHCDAYRIENHLKGVNDNSDDVKKGVRTGVQPL
jgi:hypothetical protein